jgi:uncharacterized membrane protein
VIAGTGDGDITWRYFTMLEADAQASCDEMCGVASGGKSLAVFRQHMTGVHMEHHTPHSANRARLAIGLGLVGAAVGGVWYARQRQRASDGSPTNRAVRVEQVATINRNIHDVYQFWREFENFPRFMRHLESVERLDGQRSRWRARGPAGIKVQWDAEMLEDREDEWIAWRSLPGSRVENSGSVRFAPAPGARGTEVRVQLQYTPPGGTFGRGLAWLFGEEPDIQVKDDLRRFKQLMETGEIPISDGPALWRAAQPADPKKLRSLAGVRS